MASYKDVCRLSAVDAAYVAGLVDGEGTVTLARKHAGENRHLVVSISNTERRILEFVLAIAGAGKITNKCTARAHHTPSYTYAVWNRQALSLLTQISPFMHSYKRDRALLVLAHYVRLTPRNGKYTPDSLQERTAFEESVLALRASLVRTIGAIPAPTKPAAHRSYLTSERRSGCAAR